MAAVTPQLQAALQAMGAEARNNLQALLRDFVDAELPAVAQAEFATLPVPYNSIANAGFAAVWPVADSAIDGLIAKLFPNA